jgi:hypothetical protein
LLLKYEDFSSAFIKQNKFIKILFLIQGGIILAVFLLFLGRRELFFIKASDLIDEKPLIKDICYKAFKSVVDKNPHPYLVTQEIINALKNNEFDVTINKVLAVRAISDNKCRIVIDDGEKSRSFTVSFTENLNFPFIYMLNQIEESEDLP